MPLLNQNSLTDKEKFHRISGLLPVSLVPSVFDWVTVFDICDLTISFEICSSAYELYFKTFPCRLLDLRKMFFNFSIATYYLINFAY